MRRGNSTYRRMDTLHRSGLAALLALVLLSGGFDPLHGGEREDAADRLNRFSTFSAFPGTASWETSAPQVKTIEITSSADGEAQPALFYDSGTDRKKPLLVVLHSWSQDYRQKYSIPYAVWSVAMDWVFIHPDYRGVFDNPRATGSELAVQDIVDAVEYATKHANVDTSRVYLVGFSGGAMTALIMAGRYPDLWDAVVAWVPVYNLTDWYEYVTGFPGRHYKDHIIASCGGIPRAGSAAAKECDRRSPSSYLKNARGKRLRVYLAHGIDDDFALPGNSLRAFNDLADPKDGISDEDIRYIDSMKRIPDKLAGGREYSDERYRDAGKPLLFRKTSGNAIVSLFQGRHDVLYNAGLQWLNQQSEEQNRP